MHLLNLKRKICLWNCLMLMNCWIMWRLRTCFCLIKLKLWNLNYLLLENKLLGLQASNLITCWVFKSLSSDKTGLGSVESIFVLEPYSTNFVPSSEPSVSEVVKPSMSKVAKPAEFTPSRKIMVDLQVSKPTTPNPPKGKLHDKPAWVCYFCGKFGHIHPICFKL